MHDQSLENRLRDALRNEGDSLALTITAAELERRLALRRRGGLSPVASLGLAAAVGLGLLGLVGVAGGWFDQRPFAAPPSSSPAGSAAPPAALAPSSAAVLPTLDDVLAPLDPATIVHAQSVGPADAPPAATDGPANGDVDVVFAPAVRAGVDRLWTACLGAAHLDILVRVTNSLALRAAIPVACDGSLSVRQVGLEIGDTIILRAASPVSWRVVDEAQDRPMPGASSIPAIVEAPPADETLLDRTNPGEGLPPEPDPSTGLATWSLDGLPTRDSYRVTIACAGPRPIRYRIGGIEPGPKPDATTVTEVACDGAPHRDELHLALPAGTDVALLGDPRDTWRILITADEPPITLTPNGNGWTMSTGFGPSYDPTVRDQGVSLIGPEKGGDVRVVISCSGATTLTGTIDVGPVAGITLHPFTLDCRAEGGGTLTRSYTKAGSSVDVLYDAHGASVWVAVTSLVRDPASARP